MFIDPKLPFLNFVLNFTLPIFLDKCSFLSPKIHLKIKRNSLFVLPVAAFWFIFDFLNMFIKFAFNFPFDDKPKEICKICNTEDVPFGLSNSCVLVTVSVIINTDAIRKVDASIIRIVESLDGAAFLIVDADLRWFVLNIIKVFHTLIDLDLSLKAGSRPSAFLYKLVVKRRLNFSNTNILLFSLHIRKSIFYLAKTEIFIGIKLSNYERFGCECVVLKYK